MPWGRKPSLLLLGHEATACHTLDPGKEDRLGFRRLELYFLKTNDLRTLGKFIALSRGLFPVCKR